MCKILYFSFCSTLIRYLHCCLMKHRPATCQRLFFLNAFQLSYAIAGITKNARHSQISLDFLQMCLPLTGANYGKNLRHSRCFSSVSDFFRLLFFPANKWSHQQKWSRDLAIKNYCLPLNVDRNKILSGKKWHR